MKTIVVAVLLALSPGFGWSADSPAPLVLNARSVHLAMPGAPEWEWFAGLPTEAARLDLRFTSHPNAREATLFIRQDDVKQDWPVELNGHRIGKLFLMEADLVHTLRIPAGALREGENRLSILPPKVQDDILVQNIRIDPRPLAESLDEAALDVTVRDRDANTPLPCRLTIVDSLGALAPLSVQSNTYPSARSNLRDRGLPRNPRPPPTAARPGVVYTGNGRADVGLTAGDYTLYASRGFEWSVATQHVHLAAGQVRKLSLRLRHEVPTPGLVSCDTHVHTFTHSGHGDATMDERVITLAGEGIELPIATDHNFHANYQEAARRMHVTDWFTPVMGNEVTTPAGHFNIFPIEAGARVPDFHVTDWPELMRGLRSTPGVRVIVLNHPLNVHDGFQPFARTNFNNVTGANKRGPEFGFDAIELLNSSAQQTDYLLVYRDWFALLNYGYRVVGVGSSDCHDVSRYIVGQGRTYVVCPDENPGHIDVASACSNLLAGRAFVSMGLLVRMTVDGRFGVGDLATGLGEQVSVNVKVLGPSWVSATNVTLYANGVSIREQRVNEAMRPRPASPASIEKASLTWVIPRPAHDIHLIAIATGPAVTAPFWAIPRPYQPASPHWEGRVIGSTNPIWLDADGDGQFTSARAYATRLVARHGTAPAQVLPALGAYDEAVAAQAAGLCAAAGLSPDQSELARALMSAAPQVQRAFAAFAGSSGK